MAEITKDLLKKAKQIRATDEGIQLIFDDGEVIEIPNGSQIEIL